MIKRLLLLSAAVLLLSGKAWPDVGAQLSVDATAAVVQVRPQSEGRKLIRLPTLDFSFTIRAVCALDTEARSVSISVADTRKTIGGNDIASAFDQPIVLSVPARQVSPVAVDGFCPQDGDGEQQNELLVRDAVTAHLSLRCAGKNGEQITYASRALDVILQCPARRDDQGEPTSEIAR